MKLEFKRTWQPNYKSQIYVGQKEYERIRKHTKIRRRNFMFFAFCHFKTYTHWLHVYIYNIRTYI